VPETNAEAVRAALAQSKAGNIGNYDSCSFSIKGTGRYLLAVASCHPSDPTCALINFVIPYCRFRPLKGSNPHIGSLGRVEVVDEVKIEVVVREDVLVNSLRALRAAHPYEEPAITVSEVIDYKTLLPELSQPAMVKKGVPPMSIVLEGLDGVGKSTVAIKLAEILGAKHMVTPPAIMLPAREWFVQQDNHMRKAYYMVRVVPDAFLGAYLCCSGATDLDSAPLPLLRVSSLSSCCYVKVLVLTVIVTQLCVI
jgi:hypothetical protein